jgi:alkanesulfonate monooxygenase SsuD/methylene tetrahydromethanopterin reductase-like flavin-dependent oxidoreductase (luciferase family)
METVLKVRGALLPPPAFPPRPPPEAAAASSRGRRFRARLVSRFNWVTTHKGFMPRLRVGCFRVLFWRVFFFFFFASCAVMVTMAVAREGRNVSY